jgi:hypothetical protein
MNMNPTEVSATYQQIGSEGLRAFRLAVKSFCSVRNTADAQTFLKLIDAGIVNGDGFPTAKGKALEAYLAG